MRSILIATLLIAVPTGAVFAQDIVYTGPADTPVGVATRDRLGAIAASRGFGFIDLSRRPAPASRAPALLEAGVTAYQKLQLDQAETSLRQCLAEIERTGGRGMSRRQLADAHIYSAMVAIERKAPAKPREHLVAAATLDPVRQLDPARFRPSLVAAYERARSVVASAAAAVVTLELPAGCTVRVDGGDVTGAVELSLRPGTHHLIATCPGREPLAASPSFSAGSQRYRPSLVERQPAQVRVLAATAADSVVWARLARGRLQLRLLRRGAAKAPRTWTLRIEAATDAARIEPVIDGMFAPRRAPVPRPRPDPIVEVRDAPRRWYRRPWVWAIAGAVAGAAVVLPFALGGDDNTGFQVVPEGVP